jgi:signal peptidase I
MKNWIKVNKGLLLFLMLFGVFRTAIADWNPVPTGSMRPTIQEGDVVLINRLAYDLKVPLTDIIVTRLGEPQRGDVVTFTSPMNGTRLIKRLIAVPGDVVSMKDDQVTINGKVAEYALIETLPEPVGDGATLSARRFDETMGDRHRTVQQFPARPLMPNFGPVTVPADSFLMLGDSRDNSMDSRFIGFVPRELLIGRAERILVSADMLGSWMPRFDRFGMRLE